MFRASTFTKNSYFYESMIAVAVFVIVLLLLYFNIKQYVRYKQMIEKFPGRNGHWFFGDAWDFCSDSTKNFKLFRNLAKQFPEGYRIWSVPGVAAISITTPEQAEVLLSSPKYIKKSLLYKFIQPWLKTGLLTSTGRKWALRRKLLTPAFHFNILQSLIEPFQYHNKYLMEQLNEESKKDATNIVPIISHIALNLICDTSMGVRLEAGNKSQMEYRNAVYGYSPIVQSRSIKPWYFVDFIYQFSSLYRYQTKILKVLHGFTTSIIEERKESYNGDDFIKTDSFSKKRLAMLDLLLHAKNNGEKIDDDGIREEVDTFTFEGHDTVAMALSFALLLIANHREHQVKIIAELDCLFEGSNRNASFEDLHKMPCLEMCLKESLRLFPSVSLISRYVEEDIPLDEELVIPAGTITHIHIYDIHRCERYFPEPEKFIPTRFSPENSKNLHPFAYIPFSAGPRNCIGQKYAMLELKSIVSSILRRFEMKPVDKIADVDLSLEMILRAKNGINIKFVSRNK